MTQLTFPFPLRGGLDLVTPPLALDPGRLIAVRNYDPGPKGYRRISGYERIDGHPAPSDASYWTLAFTSGATEPQIGDVIEGDVSGATADLLLEPILTGGDWGTGDAEGILVLTNLQGEFDNGEDLEVGSSTFASSASEALERGADTDDQDRDWRIAAIEAARDAIGPVPGGGPVRGAWSFRGTVYAWRDDDADAPTEGVMYRSTPTGWEAVEMPGFIAFENGTAEFEDGDTVTGGISGASATILRVVQQDGAWTNSDASGKLMIGPVTGGPFQDGETLTGAMAGSAEADGAGGAVSLPPGGRYHVIEHNFFGSADRRAMYVTNGVGPGFEFDGEVLVPIDTGMEDDRPVWVAEHQNHLFFAFRGGSLQHSGVADPYTWTVIAGAGEIALGDEITGMLGGVSTALIVFGRSRVSALFGSDSENWTLDTLSEDAGAVPWTPQEIGVPVYMDARGLRSLSATEQFGNFRAGTMTQIVEPIFPAKREAGLRVVGGVRVRGKDLYRLFWSDGSGLTMYVGRRRPEFGAFMLSDIPTCLASCPGVNEEDDDIILFGSDDGFVYRMERGASFDDDDVEAFIRPTFTHMGRPHFNKRLHRVTIEVSSQPLTTIGVTAEFSYGNVDEQSPLRQFLVSGGGGFWDESQWDRFFWSTPVEGMAEAYLSGIGWNMSISVITASRYDPPHTLHGMTIHYTERGRNG